MTTQNTLGLARNEDLPTVIFDDETEWMSINFKNYPSQYYPNSNQVETLAASIASNMVRSILSELLQSVTAPTNSVNSNTEAIQAILNALKD